MLVLGWGSTYGPIGAAGACAGRARDRQLHLRHLNPLPADLGTLLRLRQVVCPEMNLGQLALLLRGASWSTCIPHQGAGLPFGAEELADVLTAHLEEGTP